MHAEAPSSAGGRGPVAEMVEHELKELKNDWWWFFLLGVLLVICGTVAIAYPALTSLSVVIVIGAALIVGGVAMVISAFWTGQWSAMLLQLLVGILYIVVGVAIMDAPDKATALLTVMLAAFFIIVGIFRMVAALTLRFPEWGWALLNGVVTLLLGIIVYRGFPYTAYWVIGLLVGIELIFNGWTYIMLALNLRSIPDGD